MAKRIIELEVDVPACKGDKREALLEAIGRSLLLDGLRINAGRWTVRLERLSKRKEP